MKLKPEEKFLLPDDDGNLILITEIDFEYSVLQNRVIPMKGFKLEVDYDNNNISSHKKVKVQTSFTIDGVYEK
ncbi:hypothetical protein FDB24_14875 [Clostridium botulinum]|nr:hypothetical protein [Clostridium botulinum]MBN1058505.1 hypothetical protein [Clostridium botulinum]NFL87503.1 hypothetical protein [Clostridium botulinum]NFO22515.1 hypothetical protein [Clostridium botulinum]